MSTCGSTRTLGQARGGFKHCQNLRRVGHSALNPRRPECRSAGRYAQVGSRVGDDLGTVRAELLTARPPGCGGSPPPLCTGCGGRRPRTPGAGHRGPRSTRRVFAQGEQPAALRCQIGPQPALECRFGLSVPADSVLAFEQLFGSLGGGAHDDPDQTTGHRPGHRLGWHPPHPRSPTPGRPGARWPSTICPRWGWRPGTARPPMCWCWPR